MAIPKSNYRLVSDRAPSGIAYWRVYFSDPQTGKRRKISTGIVDDKTKSALVQADSVALLLLETSKTVAVPSIQERPLLGDLSRDFWDWDRSEYLKARLARDVSAISPEYAYNQASNLKTHLDPYQVTGQGAYEGCLLIEVPIDEITPDMLDDLVTYLLGKGLATQTVKHVIHSIGPVFEWALRKRQIKFNPVASMLPFGVRSQEREDFKPAEAKRLLSSKTVSEIWVFPSARQKVYRDGWRMYALSVLCAATGARWGAVVSLEREDIVLEAETDGRYYEVTLEKSLAEIRGIKPGSKTGRGTRVPVAREVLDPILPHLPASGLLFPSWGKHGVLTHHAAMRHLKLAMGNAGIGPEVQESRLLGYHSWKHTFVTRTTAAGLSAKIRSAFTEHRDESTAEIYMHLSPADLINVLPVQRALVAG